ncbi:MAG: STAS domain-containing protein [Planctomycetota bacterium]|jgi:rsbT antagonist protein RsbS
MSNDAATRIPLQVSQNCVVASIQVDLTEEVLRAFRSDLLEMLHATAAEGVILDLGGVNVLDPEDFEALRQTLEMAALMGAHTILAGLRPGVVSALVELDARVEDVHAALNLDLAFDQMRQVLAARERTDRPGHDDGQTDEANPREE